MEPKHCVLIVVRKLILLCFIFEERSRPVTFQFHVLKLNSFSSSLIHFALFAFAFVFVCKAESLHM